jgi:hypothetical protein
MVLAASSQRAHVVREASSETVRESASWSGEGVARAVGVCLGWFALYVQGKRSGSWGMGGTGILRNSEGERFMER